MLVLSRKAKQTIRIGADVEIIVKRTGRNRVVLAVDAPKSTKVLRGELIEMIDEPIGEFWLCAGACGQWRRGMPASHNGSGPVCAECESVHIAAGDEPMDAESGRVIGEVIRQVKQNVRRQRP